MYIQFSVSLCTISTITKCEEFAVNAYKNDRIDRKCIPLIKACYLKIDKNCFLQNLILYGFLKYVALSKSLLAR